MKQKIYLLLLAVFVLTSIAATEYKIGPEAPALTKNDNREVSIRTNPSGSRVETFSFYTERGNYQEVQIYLPKDYNSTNKSYPVVYLSDGSSYIGKVGDVPFIMVGIDFSWDDRWYKYSPWVNNQMEQWFGLSSPKGGGADEYLSYLVDLKTNHIDVNYRTKRERAYTAIGGHSMGGIFSIYAGMERNDVFSRVISFAPAVWFGARDINNWLSNNNFIEYISVNNPGNLNYFLYVGGMEDHEHEAPGYPTVGEFPKIYVDGVKAVHNIIGGEYIFDPTGTHSGAAYASWFHAVTTWLGQIGFYEKVDEPIEPTRSQPQPTNAPDEPTATLEPLVQPIIEATPNADGSVIHVVQYGQTAWTIAEFYEIPLEELLALNNLTEDTPVYEFQELIIVQADPEAEEAVEVSPSPTKAITTKTPSPTPTITRVSTQISFTATPGEETASSRNVSNKVIGGKTTLWLGVGLITASIFTFATLFYVSSRKDS